MSQPRHDMIPCAHFDLNDPSDFDQSVYDKLRDLKDDPIYHHVYSDDDSIPFTTPRTTHYHSHRNIRYNPDSNTQPKDNLSITKQHRDSNRRNNESIDTTTMMTFSPPLVKNIVAKQNFDWYSPSRRTCDGPPLPLVKSDRAVKRPVYESNPVKDNDQNKEDRPEKSKDAQAHHQTSANLQPQSRRALVSLRSSSAAHSSTNKTMCHPNRPSATQTIRNNISFLAP